MPEPRIPATILAEAIALTLIVAFWAIVWWPAILPTTAAALLAWSAKTTKATTTRSRKP